MKLSSRLMTIADMISDNSRVIDIGCDHGYLDIYLTLNRQNIECVAVDINTKIIENVIKNVRENKLEEKIQIVQSDGLSNIQISKNSAIVLSGLGTLTILKILKRDVTKLSDTLIIQSNNDIISLRKTVVKLGYYISDEKFVHDYGKDYVIIKFFKGKRKYNKFDYLLGPILKKDLNYVNRIINKYKIMINSIPSKYLFKRLKLKYIVYRIKKRLY